MQQDLPLNHEPLGEWFRDLRPSRNGPIVNVLSDRVRSASNEPIVEGVPLFDPRTAGWDA